MKNNIYKILGLVLFAVITSCNSWTDIESLNDTDLSGTTKTDQYYAALREWKKTPDLPQVFVWFDNWTGSSPTGEYSLRGLPDSVTIASNWGGHPKFDLSPERKADMEYIQKVKGTKVVVTLFSQKVGDDMPEDPIYDIGNSSDEAIVRPAIRKYAEAIYDAVVESGYDGFDWDYEPYGGGDRTAYLWLNSTQSKIFIEELGYWFGKNSQRTDRDGRKPAIPNLLLLVDGEIGVGKGLGKDWDNHNIDYFVLQAYGSTTDSGRTTRVRGVLRDLSEHIKEGRITEEEVIRRTILTENFESYANTGGGFLGMSNFIFEPDGLNVQIGGCGLYRSGFDYASKGLGDYDGSPEYYYLRQGITNLYSVFYDRLNNSNNK